MTETAKPDDKADQAKGETELVLPATSGQVADANKDADVSQMSQASANQKKDEPKDILKRMVKTRVDQDA